MTSHADGICLHCCCPREAVMMDVMMTMAGKREGKAMVRRQQDNDKVMAR